jgi:hypothetical protein
MTTLTSVTSASRPTSLLFEIPDGKLDAVPKAVPPASFVALGALEVQHIERWVAARPEVLGERLLLITTQFAGFDPS